ncbi:MAG: three-Cys-motif partner protein TcmP [Vogesella sp.]|uniref:three-Cys-motif partner protein TcmP n=1 Tax=Vogesella sp. TaxID=1904252 RepID=UPI00391BD406
MSDLHYHGFGGNWTVIKLEMLQRYLEAFNTALQGKPLPSSPFRRVFIDAFAGTGECAITLDGKTVRIDGSAKLALEVQPGFDDYYFIDLKAKHVKALNELAQTYPGKRVAVLAGDGNARVGELLQQIGWKGSRAVMFLDPYGMAVRWETLQQIAATGAIDLWYLFPLNAVCRQAANQFDKVDASKSEALTRLFGTTDWVEDFYRDTDQTDLFAEEEMAVKRQRVLSQDEILAYMQRRLRTIFPVVLDPIKLPDQGSPIFALFFASANPSQSAVKLTKRIAGHLLNMQLTGMLRTKPLRVGQVVGSEGLFG